MLYEISKSLHFTQSKIIFYIMCYLQSSLLSSVRQRSVAVINSRYLLSMSSRMCFLSRLMGSGTKREQFRSANNLQHKAPPYKPELVPLCSQSSFHLSNKLTLLKNINSKFSLFQHMNNLQTRLTLYHLIEMPVEGKRKKNVK